jgi:acetyl esterase/lipase
MEEVGCLSRNSFPYSLSHFSEDKLDHSGMARRLVAVTGFAVAVPNYRLSPCETTEANAIRHPDHAKDVLCFLKFIMAWGGPEGIDVYDPNRLCLMGHSCGAHMLSSIFLEANQAEDPLRPPLELLKNTKAIVTSEGLYDIDLLITSFPTYRAWFIEAALGRRSSYEEVSVTKMTPRVEYNHLHWLIVHSKGDTLVDEAQSEAMYQHLLHTIPHVTKNFDELKEEHNAILKGREFVEIAGQYIIDKMPLST